ncbi:MAG: ABC transporter substrate-binding protein [Betaproteobacteria bacterium]|nr:MAG: ABC transporter substrate-binding protein [Betaproteobacteria bacterium]TMH92196.1 MAG: ABC transporter substrate-binding protein [Betaproteobacteria bacterium]
MTTTRALTAAVGALACLFAGSVAHAQGVTKTNILIGQSSPFSGSNKELGDDIREGLQAYFKRTNEAGGVNGRTLELIALDDANDAKRSGENARILIEQRGVLALIGYASATLSLPALPFVEKSKIAFVGPFTGAEPMRAFRRNVYNIRASYADELEKIVDFYTITGMKKFSVIHYDDAIGKENLTAVELALTKRGLKPSSIGTLKRNQTDLGAAVSDVIKAAPDVVIATTLYKTTGDFIKSARKAGSGAQFASISFVGASALAGELGEQGMGVVVSQVVPPYTRNSIPIVREYQAAIEKSLGKKEYSFTSLESYIGAKVLVEAIRRAGANPTREGLLKTLDSIQNFNVGGYLVDFSPSNHNGSRFVELTAIGKSGRFAY